MKNLEYTPYICKDTSLLGTFKNCLVENSYYKLDEFKTIYLDNFRFYYSDLNNQRELEKFKSGKLQLIQATDAYILFEVFYFLESQDTRLIKILNAVENKAGNIFSKTSLSDLNEFN